jgi:hypothetical protein
MRAKKPAKSGLFGQAVWGGAGKGGAASGPEATR